MNVCESNNFDNYILLLSSDWCTFFLSVDLEVSNKDMVMIKEAARSAVKHLMWSFNRDIKIFYNIDFSLNRKKKTWSIFCSQLNSEILEKKISDFINNLLFDQYSENNTAYTFLILLEDFSNKNEMGINLDFLGEKKLIISNIIKNFNNGNLDDHYDNAMASKTNWDTFLISIRPDLPSALSDFYDITIKRKDSFKKIWGEIKFILANDEREQLLTVLSDKHFELADDKCDLPKWL